MTGPATTFHRPLAAALALAATLACAASAGRSAGRALEGTHWRLAERGGQPAVVVEGPREPHLVFGADSGRVAGSSGCNRMSGTYTRSAEALTFGPIISTKMACADDRLNHQEAAFQGALAATRRHRIAGDTLTLLAEAGVVARLVAVPR